MDKIPTAEEFFKSQIPKYESVSQFMTDGDIFYYAKQFAKLHVEAALRAAHLNQQLPIEDLKFTSDAYPLEKIK